MEGRKTEKKKSVEKIVNEVAREVSSFSKLKHMFREHLRLRKVFTVNLTTSEPDVYGRLPFRECATNFVSLILLQLVTL